MSKQEIKSSEITEVVQEVTPFGHDLKFLSEVGLETTLELGRVQMTVRDFLKLKVGSVIELDKEKGAPLDILANKNLIARGEPLVVNERMGARVTELINPKGWEDDIG